MPAPLRILHLIPTLGVGGAELQLHQLVSRTPPEAAVHEVAHYSGPGEAEALDLFAASGVPLHHVPRPPGNPWGFLRSLAATIAAARPDVVHCWLVSACFWGRLAARRAGVSPVAYSIRSSGLERAGVLRLARWYGESGAWYLANSSAVAATIRRRLGVPADRIVVIMNGVEGRLPAPSPPRDAPGRDAAPAGPGAGAIRRVVAIGRLAVEKNYPMLLRVAARFDPASGVRFDIVGHGELEGALEEEAARLGLGDRVRFLGLRRDIPAILAEAEVFAFTSRIEGAPNALLEAMAAGLPIVTTRFDGIDDILAADREALVVDHDDDQAFEAALRRLLADPEAARALGARARHAAATRFSVAAMVDATLAFYRRALASDGRAARRSG